MDLFYQYRIIFIRGLVETLELSIAMAICGTLCAILFTIGVMAKSAVVRNAFFVVVETARDLPLMVTVLVVYYILPLAGISLDPFWSCVGAISVWGGANGAHVLRAGLASVGKGQRETAAAFGFGPVKGLFLITLPQAMPVILPPYVNLLTELVQATSLGAVIGAAELSRSGQIVIEQTTILQGGAPAYVIYGGILVVYFILCSLISFVGGRIEKIVMRPYASSEAAARVQAKVHDIEANLSGSA